MNSVFLEIVVGIVVGIVLIIGGGFFNRWLIRRDRIIQVPQDLGVLTNDLKVNLDRLVIVEKDLMHARINIATIFGRINGKHKPEVTP